MISRRTLLTGAAATVLARPAAADVDPGWRPGELDVREVAVPGEVSRRFHDSAPFERHRTLPARA